MVALGKRHLKTELCVLRLEQVQYCTKYATV